MFWRLYDQATTVLLALAGAGMFGVTIANALLRYLFAAPLVWSEELSRYFMVWGTMLGVALAYRLGQHVFINLVADWLPPRRRRALGIACHLLVLTVAVTIVHSGWTLVALLGRVSAPSSGIEMSWIYSAIPVGGALLVVVLNLMIGLITPPMGLCLFVADSIARVGLAAILRRIWPFLLGELVVLALVTAVPGLSTWLPRQLGYGS
jgi:TRAP-type C4-dicarboxylate transport system permease small subunit